MVISTLGVLEVLFSSFLDQLSPSRSAEALPGSVPNSSQGGKRLYFFRPDTPWGSAALSDAF